MERVCLLSRPIGTTSDSYGKTQTTYEEAFPWWCTRHDRSGRDSFAGGVEHLNWDVEFRGAWDSSQRPGTNWLLVMDDETYDIQWVGESQASRWDISILARRRV